ncbi:MAG TPA: cytochrome c [Acidimicrobiales bacterium]|nr:cytochrome c [Acidimicrobiales bacterium]
MSAERPHARQAAAARARKRQQGRRMLPVLITLGVVVVAAAVTALVLSAGGSDEPPAPGSPEELALGEEVFVDSCQTCHGEGAQGGLAGPPLVHEMYQDLEDDDIRTAVRQGKAQENWEYAPMPPVPGIEAHEVEAVIAYVRSQQSEAWGEEP